MAVSKKQQACVNRYMKNHYDQIMIRPAKGYKQIIQDAAGAAGLSVNAYIIAAINSALERDGFDPSTVDDAPQTE